MGKVIVYTKFNCSKCENTKKFLEMREIEFEARNVETNEVYMSEVLDTGLRSMPVILVEGLEPFTYNMGQFIEVFGEL